MLGMCSNVREVDFLVFIVLELFFIGIGDKDGQRVRKVYGMVC